MTEIRRGSGYAWKMTTSLSISEGFTVDNLDKKNLEEGINDFERTFIAIRDSLKEIESLCLDNEEERLQVCQVLARRLDQSKRSIYKD